MYHLFETTRAHQANLPLLHRILIKVDSFAWRKVEAHKTREVVWAELREEEVSHLSKFDLLKVSYPLEDIWTAEEVACVFGLEDKTRLEVSVLRCCYPQIIGSHNI